MSFKSLAENLMEVHKVKGIQCPDDTLARSLKKKKKGQRSFPYASPSGPLAGCTRWGAKQWGDGLIQSSHPQEGGPPSTVTLRPDGAC